MSAGSFSFGTRLGLVFIVQTASLSGAAVVYLLGYIAYCAATGAWSMGTHLHWYFLSMLISEVIQAAAGIINIQWIIDAGVEEGSLCTTQAILAQLGDVGVALASLAIGVHTFCVLFFRWNPGPSPRIALVVISGIWIFLALIVGIGAATHKGKHYWGDTQYWCWITRDYLNDGIYLEYFWMWVTAFLNLLQYILLALVIKGYIVVDGFHISILKQKQRQSRVIPVQRRTRNANEIAMQMIFYPAIYIITVLPIAIARFRAFHAGGSHVPFAATVFADVLFASSGLFNVLLFSFTRPSLVPSRDAQDLSSAGVHTILQPKRARDCRPPQQSSDSTASTSLISAQGHCNAGNFRVPPLTPPARTLSKSSNNDCSAFRPSHNAGNDDYNIWLRKSHVSSDNSNV